MKNNFKEIFKQLRLERGLTTRGLAEAMGVSKSTVSMYELGERIPPLEGLEEIADFFNVDIEYLLGKSKIRNKAAASVGYNSYAEYLSAKCEGGLRSVRLKRFPLLGNIACGEPIYAEEDHSSYIDASADINADFCLTAKGDSMIGARIQDGDTVFVRRQETVQNGEIAVVLIGDEATLKRWNYDEDHGILILSPENSAYQPLIFTGDRLNEVRCLGKAVFFMSKIK